MGYKEAYKQDLSRYNELIKEYEEIINDPHYMTVCEEMPFVFLEAKQKAEMLELYRDLGDKNEAPFKFNHADEAINFLKSIISLRKNLDEILENASIIVRADGLAKEINSFVEESPYLPNDLCVGENSRLSGIAKDCLEKLPKYPTLMTKAFQRSFIESCIECLEPQGLDMLVKTHYIGIKDMSDIRLTGSKAYEDNIAYLQGRFNLSELVCEHQTIRLAGTTHANDDGSSRQDFLAEVAKYKGEIELKCKKGKYNNKKLGKLVDSVEISWNDHVLGYVPQGVVDQMFAKYGDPQFKADFIKIVGGGSVSYGCEVELGVVAKELEKEAEEEPDSPERG